MKIKTINDLEYVKRKGLKKLLPNKPRVTVGLATCGIAAGASEIYEYIKELNKKRDINVLLSKTGCFGICHEEPLINIRMPGKPIVTFNKVKKDDVDLILKNVLEENIIDIKAFFKIEEWDHLTSSKKISYGKDYSDIPLWNENPYFKPQKKIVLRDAGIINPEDIEEYIAIGGYHALYKALMHMNPESVVNEVKKSGLRGRGGAGFPTGLKWDFAKKEVSDTKYVICNADEGDPGAYMNRNEMESDPHMILEGMAIGAYAIGASEGYIYVRAEYPLAIKRLKKAITQAEKYGLLGNNIFDTDFSFTIHLAIGAGAFVCGEETALIASIEGNPGRTRHKPPFPAQKGLWGKPTNINNVETWANIAPIINNGGKWFSKIGTKKSSGTKVFSLVGKINKPGLAEVPLGTTLDTIMYDIGNGGNNGKRIKAVQTGGPSGGCIPAHLFDTPVDYENLAKVGSIMGSGGIIVMDENTCMVNTAKYFLEFTSDESCGKCVPCREGNKQLLNILEKITTGNGVEKDINRLLELGETIKLTALCGLGQTAPNPVLTTIRYFRDEYEEHIKYKKCRAGVCEDLVYAPCHNACPLGQDAPSYIAYIAKRNFDKALEVIMRTNPFPRILGRVCPSPCENHCRSGESGQPLAIRALKRFVADNYKISNIKIDEYQNKKVAVIGSGPAGLSAAYFLAVKGYDITIFESLPVLGGMLRVGIPEYRLPRDVIDDEIQRIKDLGVNIKTNITLGKDLTISKLFEDGFESVFIGVGLHKGIKLNIPGEDAKGVIDGIDFLREKAFGHEVPLGENIYVIGGGNTAMDVARSAYRYANSNKLNKKVKINVMYRRTKNEMPALPEEVKEALREGINIQFLTAPNKIIAENNKIKAVEWIRMKLGKIDRSGRRRPIPIKGSEFITPVDTLIIAIGQDADFSFLEGNNDLKIKGKTIAVDRETLETSIKGVFAGGDIVTGPTTVVEAAAAGKIAAYSIDKYLHNLPLKRKYEINFPNENAPLLQLSTDEIERISSQKRVEPKKISIAERINNFKEVEQTLSEEEAVKEAYRCLRCDVRG